MSFGTFASLVNSKVVVPSTRNDYWAVNKHFLSDLLSTRLRQVHVDQAWYLSRYPDVAKAIESGTVADAAEHYRKFGYFEHRMPARIEVQEDWYLKEYADVGTAVRERVFPSAQAHFDLVGYAEGRLPWAGFSLEGPPATADETGMLGPDAERLGRQAARGRAVHATSDGDSDGLVGRISPPEQPKNTWRRAP